MDLIQRLNEIFGPPPVYCWGEGCHNYMDVEPRVVEYTEDAIYVKPLCDDCFFEIMRKEGGR
jgi:hypothetical protein